MNWRVPGSLVTVVLMGMVLGSWIEWTSESHSSGLGYVIAAGARGAMYFGAGALLAKRLSTRTRGMQPLIAAVCGAVLLTLVEYALPAVRYDLDPANQVDSRWVRRQAAFMVGRIVVFSVIVTVGSGCASAVAVLVQSIARRIVRWRSVMLNR